MSSECGGARRHLIDRSMPRRLDDNLLAAQRHADKCPECRNFIAECEATVNLSKRSLSVPAPGALRERLFEAIAAKRTRATSVRRLPLLATAVIGASIVGLLLGYSVMTQRSFDTTIASIVADHAIAADDDHFESGNAAEIEAWLTARVAYAVMVPTLAGARVVGARTCMTPRGRGAVIEYEIDGRRVSYFILEAVLREFGEDGVRLAGTKGYSIAHWRDRGLVHAFVGALSSDRIKALAHECIHQAESRRATVPGTREPSSRA